MALEKLVGSVIYTAPGPLGYRLPVHVAMAHAPLMPPLGKVNPRERKERSIWNNQRRNLLLAELVQGFADNQIERLWAAGLLLDQQSLPQCQGSRRVALLTESPAHGRRLQALLPGWPLLDKTRDQSERTCPSYWPVSPGESRWIITAVRASGLAQLQADVVIWCGGGDRALLPASFPPQRTCDSLGGVLLVDLADGSDEVECRATQRRLEDYQSHGYQVLAASTDRRMNFEGQGASLVHLSRSWRSGS